MGWGGGGVMRDGEATTTCPPSRRPVVSWALHRDVIPTDHLPPGATESPCLAPTLHGQCHGVPGLVIEGHATCRARGLGQGDLPPARERARAREGESFGSKFAFTANNGHSQKVDLTKDDSTVFVW
jgi:hypothetical protein